MARERSTGVIVLAIIGILLGILSGLGILALEVWAGYSIAHHYNWPHPLLIGFGFMLVFSALISALRGLGRIGQKSE